MYVTKSAFSNGHVKDKPKYLQIFTILYIIFRLLRGLAIFDALFLFAAILSFGLPTLSQWFNDEIFMRIMATLFGLLHTFRTGSVYVTLAVTFERFYSIVCPFRHNR